MPIIPARRHQQKQSMSQAQQFQVVSLTPLLVLQLFLMHVVPVLPQNSRWPCPDSCQCREDHVAQVGRTYAVLCSGQRLTSIPDLKPLVPAVTVPVMLKLDYCDVGNVTQEDFPPGFQLSILHLNGNAGLRMAADALHNVRDSLVLLDMQAVNLPFNDTLHFLQGCHRLRELSLSFNNKGHGHAKNVTAALFKDLGLTNLTKLKLYNCNIHSLAEHVFDGAESMEDLHLGSNLIEEMPEALGRLQQLQVLDLSSNALYHLPNGSLTNLTRLTELNLHMNSIATMEDAAFDGVHASLNTLIMSFCSLRDVPTEAIRLLTNLTSLDLTGNMFSTIGPDAFVGSYCLTELYVSSKTMAFDKLMFTGQKFCIKDLKIRKAELISVPLDPIKDLVKLQYLFLDKNNISRLKQDELKGITATSISFSDNPLRTVEKGAFSGLRPKLALLLERTELSDLSFIFDYPKDTFRFLSLYESPIPCDCTLKRILESQSENFLYGTCSHEGQAINLKHPELSDILAQKCPCTPETALANQTTTVEVDTVRPYTVQPPVQRRQKQVAIDTRKENSQNKNRRKSKKSKSSKAISSSVRLFNSFCSFALLVLVCLLTT